MKAPERRLDDATPCVISETSRRDFFKTVGTAAACGMAAAVTPGCDNGSDANNFPDGGDVGGERERVCEDTTVVEQDGGTVDCDDFDLITGDPAFEAYWQQVRSKFVLPSDTIYLNTGTQGSMPCFVLDKMKNDFERFAAQPTDAIINDGRCNLFLTGVRMKVASFLGADAGEIVLTNNTTEGLGWVSHGLDFAEGDEIVTTVHFQPYNACLKFLRDRKNITLSVIDLPTPGKSEQEIIDAFASAITPNTKMFCFCHINYATGLRMPVKEICALARANGITTLVDAAHALGQIDVDVKDLGADFYATSPHKWLCAPPGTGVLYMRDEMQEQVWPSVTEMYLATPESPITWSNFSIRGQQCTPAYAGILDAMDFQNAIGKETIEQRVLKMAAYTKEKVIEKWGQESLFSPMAEELSTGMVAFDPLAGKPKAQFSGLFSALWDRNIIVRNISFMLQTTDTSPTNLIRICTHLYNNYDQIDTALSEIDSFVASL